MLSSRDHEVHHNRQGPLSRAFALPLREPYWSRAALAMSAKSLNTPSTPSL